MSLHLEDIDEVRRETQRQRYLRIVLTEVGEPDSLVQAVFPEKSAALDMDDALWNGTLAEGTAAAGWSNAP